MTTHASAMRKASARLEALESRSMFSGEIDHSFGTGGYEPIGLANSFAVARNPVIATQSDGKILVAGSAGGKATVSRYLANGQVDTSFGTKGTVTVSNVNGNQIDSLNVLANGSILVPGVVSFRLTSAGKLDTTFGGGDGEANSMLAKDKRQIGINASVVLPDGSYFDFGAGYLFKYKADGSPDKSFGVSGAFSLKALNKGDASTFELGGIAADAQGRLYVSYADSVSDPYFYPHNKHVARITAAGKLDTSWAKAGVFSSDDNLYEIGSTITVTGDNRVLFTEQRSTISAFALRWRPSARPGRIWA